MKGSNLQVKDIIVALDGYRVRSSDQYDIIRERTADPNMDFIVWRDGKYLEIKNTLPHRLFHSDVESVGPSL